MKYLHIFPVEKFTTSYINFINKNFAQQDHFFLLYGAPPSEEMVSHSNVWYCDSFKRRLFTLEKLLFRAQKIYFHSLFLPDNFFLLLFLQSWLLKKSHWVIWGGDLYQFKDACIDVKSRIVRWIKKNVISKMVEASAYAKGDYQLAQNLCGINGKHMDAIYPNPIKQSFLDRIKRKQLQTRKLVNIQLGNSATPTNQHIKAIDMLKRFQNENIKIYCPLSYGNKQYADEISKYGVSVFGEKFIPMFHFLSPDEYAKFLGEIDIAIFNQNRQQGVNNILALLYLGKKIFLRSDTTMWQQLVQQDLYYIDDIDSIGFMSFSEFSFISKNHIEDNMIFASEMFSEDYIKKMWSKIFESYV